MKTLEERRAYQRRRYQENQKAIRGKRRALYLANKEKDPEKVKEDARVRRERRKIKANAYSKKWHQRNPDYNKNWIKKNHQRRLVTQNKNWHIRRARLRSLQAEKVSRLEIYQRDEGLCYLCQGFVPWEQYHLDHVMPLSKGGPHIRSNLRVTHRDCNLRKGDKVV